MCGLPGPLPLLDSLPWLFPETGAALAEWRGRLHLLLGHLEREARACQRDLESGAHHALTRERLQVLAEGYLDQAARLRKLLAPLDVQSRMERHEVRLALGTELPQTQGLTTYYPNIHRDWCWGEQENRAACELVAGLWRPAHPPRRLLVLGAGAGRLAYDLHQSQDVEITVALDFNPLLATIGRRVSSGETVSLYEFPIAPRSIADHARLRVLAAPAPARDGLYFLLADALAAPFRAGVFDSVLTPWLVDIVPDDLQLLMQRINKLLAPGGHWLFLGSLAWADRPPSQCYSLEELLALAPAAGLAPGEVREEAMPYMASPASRHARRETVIALEGREKAWRDDPDAARNAAGLAAGCRPACSRTAFFPRAVAVHARLCLPDGDDRWAAQHPGHGAAHGGAEAHARSRCCPRHPEIPGAHVC